MATRDLIIYDLTQEDINNLNDIFILHNNTWFNQLNIEEECIIFLQNNSLQYDYNSQIFKKIRNENFKEENEPNEPIIHNSKDINQIKQNFNVNHRFSTEKPEGKIKVYVTGYDSRRSKFAVIV